MTRLGDVAEIIRGVTFKTEQLVGGQTEGAVVCLRTKNVQVELDLSDVLYVPVETVKNPKQFLREKDIVISSANSWNLVGKCAWAGPVDRPTTIGGFICAMRVTSHTIDPRYLFRWFSTSEVQALVRSFGQQTTNISNLNVQRTLDLDIPLPPISEQRRIAAILDQADELRAKRRRALTLLEELADAIFVDSFERGLTWPAAPFARLLSVPLRNGVSPATRGTVDGEVLTLSAITRGRFDPSVAKFAKFERAYDESKTVREGELLICRGNGNRDLVGRGELATISLPNTAFPDTMIAARLNDTLVDGAYIQAVWHRPLIRRQIAAGARTTNGTFKVNQAVLDAIQVPVPPIAVQRKYSNRLGRLREAKASQFAHLAKLDELFASLQHRAFAGQL